MGDSVLAQQIAENNRTLQAENSELSETNESLTKSLDAYKVLGTPEEIAEKLAEAAAQVQSTNEITESYQNMVESFGGEEVIVESLSRMASFEAEHGKLDEVGEALLQSKTVLENLKKFEEAHGTLDKVAESQTLMAARMPEIQESLELAKTARAFIEERGSFELVGEALDMAGAHLGQISEANKLTELEAVAESYGKTPEELNAIMENFNIAIDQIDEKFAILGFEKKVEDVEEASATEEVVDGEEITEEYDEDGKKMKDKMDEEEEEMEESHKPGRAFSQMITGRAFLDVSENVDESKLPKKIEESRDTAPGSRFSRMVGAVK